MSIEHQFDYELIQDILGRMILHWNYRNLREIPVEVLNNGEHIEEIYLKRNCLEKLPADFGKLCNLTNLYLVGNQLEELPVEIGDLKCLKVLDLSQNYLRRLPNTVGKLNSLESLLLTYNQLDELPKCFKELQRLKELELSGNRIYSLPSDIIQGLQSLEEFGIDRNPISSIPRNISLLRHLRYFSACRCNLLLLPSLPFSTLIFKDRTLKSNSGGLNSNKNLQFLFDGNPRLNYIPYWVLQLLGTNVECFGCGLEPGESYNEGANPRHHNSGATASQEAQNQIQLYSHRGDVDRPKIKLNFKGKRRTLHFDEELLKLHHCGFNAEAEGKVKVAVASLLELSLRRIFHLGLLDDIESMTCGCGPKPVVEPLIVPQRAGRSLIMKRGDLSIRENVMLPEGSAMNSISTCHAYNPVSSSSLFDKTTMKSADGKGKQNTFLCNLDAGISNQRENSTTETGSATPTHKEHKQQNHHTNARNCNISSVLLPANLNKLLRTGPVAKCFECLKPIFTEAWPIIFHIPRWAFDQNDEGDQLAMGANIIHGDWDDIHEDGKLSIGCVQFCSASCVTRFRRGTYYKSSLRLNNLRCIVENEIPWVIG